MVVMPMLISYDVLLRSIFHLQYSRTKKKSKDVAIPYYGIGNTVVTFYSRENFSYNTFNVFPQEKKSKIQLLSMKELEEEESH
jgi:hypothetical protein